MTFHARLVYRDNQQARMPSDQLDTSSIRNTLQVIQNLHMGLQLAFILNNISIMFAYRSSKRIGAAYRILIKRWCVEHDACLHL